MQSSPTFAAEGSFPAAARAADGQVLLRALLLEGLPQLLRVLWAQLEALVTARAATATELASKFVSEDGARSLSFGDQKSFFGGLERLLGPPSPQLMEAMRREHCASVDSKLYFTSSNYGVTTTSEAEWLFAPYSFFTVESVDYKDSPTWTDPHRVVLRVAPDNRLERADVPNAPWG